MMVAIVLMSHKMITARVKKVQQNINDSICPYMGMYICRDLGSIFVGSAGVYMCAYMLLMFAMKERLHLTCVCCDTSWKLCIKLIE